MHDHIVDALDHLDFEEDELIYLALNSKVERQVVDRLAWQLHNAVNVDASREWMRADLAVFTGGSDEPDVLIEAKAFSSLAVREQWDIYLGKMSKDVEKARELREKRSAEAEIYLLAVMTHVDKVISLDMKHLIKYPAWLKHPVPLDEAKQKVRAFLDSNGQTQEIELQSGEVWDVRARVIAWICGPIEP